VPLQSSASRLYGRPRRRRRRTAPLIAFLVLLLVIGGGVATGLVLHQRSDERARRLQSAAEATVTAWVGAESRAGATAVTATVAATAMAAQATPTTRAAAQQWLAAQLPGLRLTSLAVVAGPVASTGATPGADYTATAVLSGLGTWAWKGHLPLVRDGAAWGVDWSPTVFHPQLAAGARLERVRMLGKRGTVTLADGSAMAGDTELSDNLLGSTAKLTAAQLAGRDTHLQAGDVGGSTGFERVFDNVLAGAPGGSVTAVSSTGASTTLVSFGRKDGADVKTTLDASVQRAGEKTFVGTAKPAHLAALDWKTGQVLALVDNPVGGYAGAIRGQYPPGSTFKIITTSAALIAGVPAGQTLTCGPTQTVDGRPFKNAEAESFGAIDFATAFAKSCNTWFVQLAQKVPTATLTSTAQLFGFATSQGGAAGILPITSFGGSYPPPRDLAQAAGQAIGQDQVLASPLQMASVAAAVASGTWTQPHVTADAKAVSHPLPAGVVDTLRGFMGGVVAPGGTAAGARLPAGTYGKTGTAEVGGAGTATDAWFVAVHGSVAVAVEVDGGGFGGDVAAPLAARFLQSLGSR